MHLLWWWHESVELLWNIYYNKCKTSHQILTPLLLITMKMSKTFAKNGFSRFEFGSDWRYLPKVCERKTLWNMNFNSKSRSWNTKKNMYYKLIWIMKKYTFINVFLCLWFFKIESHPRSYSFVYMELFISKWKLKYGMNKMNSFAFFFVYFNKFTDKTRNSDN